MFDNGFVMHGHPEKEKKMADLKKTTTAKTASKATAAAAVATAKAAPADKKAEAPKAAAKVEAPKATAKVEAPKTTAKAAPKTAAKAAPKTAAKADKKTEAPKAETPAKRAYKKREVKKPVEKIQEVYFQYQGNEILAQDVVAKIHAAYKAEGHKVGAIKSLRVYINAEEMRAYYVINDKPGDDKFIEL